ncbi:MAG TPA: HD domain-containing protein [Candidatus Lokiarchaeia archaeon]|nr:HD domain-containing protein [Candidatus Lokiarchaeia archaeon]
MPEFEPQLLAMIDNVFPESLSHGKFHVFRVVTTCKKIAAELEQDEGMSIDMDVVLAAAYLHDLGRLDSIQPYSSEIPDPELPHAERSIAFARDILERMQEYYPAEKIPFVESTILAHSFSAGEEPATIEAMILSDADKLDAMGAQGIIRTIAYSVEQHRTLESTLEHFTKKIVNLHGLLKTEPAKAMGAEKQALLEQFTAELAQDLRDTPRLESTSSR